MIPRVSIIVPIYKVEKELDRCVNSLIDQSLTEIEIILVNDGSPDRCPLICDEYARCDSRIRVIHKENGGLSDARNAGLKIASGEYVLFVDADDFIELDACEKLMCQITDETIEIVTGVGYRTALDGTRTKINDNHSLPSSSLTGVDYMKMKLGNKNFWVVVWLYLYKREFIMKHNLYFKKGLLHEDNQWTPRVFLLAKKVISTDIYIYNYMVRADSITQVQNKTKHNLDLMRTVKELESIFNKSNDAQLRVLMKDWLLDQYLAAFFTEKMYRKEYAHYIDKSFVLQSAKSIKNKFRSLLFFISPRMYWEIANFSKIVRKHICLYEKNGGF